MHRRVRYVLVGWYRDGGRLCGGRLRALAPTGYAGARDLCGVLRFIIVVPFVPPDCGVGGQPKVWGIQRRGRRVAEDASLKRRGVGDQPG
ncbi:MAG: hypothetical protein HYX92_16435 [Chloroflexi bacterium]|nr:hypothetical protein [Chloroflexota bacterium]